MGPTTDSKGLLQSSVPDIQEQGQTQWTPVPSMVPSSRWHCCLGDLCRKSLLNLSKLNVNVKSQVRIFIHLLNLRFERYRVELEVF